MPPQPIERKRLLANVAPAHKRIIRLVVRFVRRNALFYDEDLTNLPRLVSAVYVGMKAVEIVDMVT
jgi:hypothetical protein